MRRIAAYLVPLICVLCAVAAAAVPALVTPFPSFVANNTDVTSTRVLALGTSVSASFPGAPSDVVFAFVCNYNATAYASAFAGRADLFASHSLWTPYHAVCNGSSVRALLYRDSVAYTAAYQPAPTAAQVEAAFGGYAFVDEAGGASVASAHGVTTVTFVNTGFGVHTNASLYFAVVVRNGTSLQVYASRFASEQCDAVARDDCAYARYRDPHTIVLPALVGRIEHVDWLQGRLVATEVAAGARVCVRAFTRLGTPLTNTTIAFVGLASVDPAAHPASAVVAGAESPHTIRRGWNLYNATSSLSSTQLQWIAQFAVGAPANVTYTPADGVLCFSDAGFQREVADGPFDVVVIIRGTGLTTRTASSDVVVAATRLHLSNCIGDACAYNALTADAVALGVGIGAGVGGAVLIVAIVIGIVCCARLKVCKCAKRAPAGSGASDADGRVALAKAVEM